MTLREGDLTRPSSAVPSCCGVAFEGAIHIVNSYYTWRRGLIMAAPTLDEIAHQVGPQVARAFAPYFIEEFRQLPEFNPRPLISNDYDPATCAVFVTELGDDVVKRADKFFTAL